LVLRRRIIGTTQGQGVYRRGRLHTGTFITPICRAKITGVDRATLYRFISSRRLIPE
jgi:hypothetical protein